MNEDLTYTMGLNTDPFSRALKTAGQQVDTAASAILGKLSQIANGFGSLVGAGAIIGFAKSVFEMSESIRRTSIEVGVSTDYFQNFRRLLRSSGVDAEFAEKALEKLNTRLGLAQENSAEFDKMQRELGFSLTDNIGRLKTTEQINNEVADAIRNATSEQEAAGIAAAAYGAKLSVNLIPALKRGSLAIAEMSEKTRMSKDDIEEMHEAGNTIKEMWDNALISASKFFNFLSNKNRMGGSPAVGQDGSFEAFLPFDPTGRNGHEASSSSESAGKKINDTEAYAEAVKKLKEAKQKELEVSDHVAARDKAKNEASDAYDAMGRAKIQEIAHGKYIEYIEAQTEFKNKKRIYDAAQKKVDEDILKVEKEKNEEAKKAARLKKEAVDLTYEEDKVNTRIAREQRSLYEKNYAHLSVSELYNSSTRFSGTLGQDQQTANRITWLEQWAERNRTSGYFDKSNEQRDEARRLRKTLSTNVDQDDREPNTQLLEEIQDSNKHLKFLSDKAATTGIPTDPAMKQ